MTFSEFDKLPDPENGEWYELHGGELVRMTRPKLKHSRIQRRLRRLLEAVAKGYVVEIEVPFRAKPEHEFRVADVAAIAEARWNGAPEDSYLIGSPELVVEVVSPSNNAEELLDNRLLCLDHGAEEFWIVHPKKRVVEVFNRTGSHVYRDGEHVPVRLFGGANIPISSIFADTPG
jgi:Uma2 family endonuclease